MIRPLHTIQSPYPTPAERSAAGAEAPAGSPGIDAVELSSSRSIAPQLPRLDAAQQVRRAPLARRAAPLLGAALLAAAAFAGSALPAYGVGASAAPASVAVSQLIGTGTAQTLRTRLESAVKEIPGLAGGQWSSVDGSCMDISAQWLEPLAQRGVPAALSITDSSQGASNVTLRDGSRIYFHKVHAFVTVSDGQRELIVDPTWKQFVADKQASAHLPDILVGTVDELKSVYASIAPQLQLETTGADPRQGMYDPASAVDLLYSSGPYAHLRMMLK